LPFCRLHTWSLRFVLIQCWVLPETLKRVFALAGELQIPTGYIIDTAMKAIVK
jgi:hypothetical protein